MIKIFPKLILFSLFSFAGIFGENDIIDPINATGRTRENLNSTFTIMNENSLEKTTDGGYRVRNRALKNERGFCEDEKFAEQISSGECSGTLIAPDTVLTAAHCVDGQRQCESFKFVFGFQVQKISTPAGLKEATRTRLNQDDVYSCDKVLFRQYNNSLDIAIIKLDRGVTGRQPVSWRRSGTLNQGDNVYLLGSPWGLPVKYSDGDILKVGTNTGGQATYDESPGHSGGPVFNSEHHVLEGVHVTSVRTVYFDETGCRRWGSRDNFNEGQTYNHPDMSSTWTHGTGFVPVSYFRDQLERYARPASSGSGEDSTLTTQ